MNANLTRLIILATVALVVTTPSALAQRQLGKKKGPKEGGDDAANLPAVSDAPGAEDTSSVMINLRAACA